MSLERKEKLFGKCHKRKCSISKKDYQDIMNGNHMEVFWRTDSKLLKEFIVDIETKAFKPKVIIDYKRTAFVEEITNIRITIDNYIQASGDVSNFLTQDYISRPIQDLNYNVLEVKFDYILPGYIRNIVETYSFNQTSFSKYYLGRKKVGGFIYD